MGKDTSFERGDHVLHKSSGEEWVVKRAGKDGAGGFVEPCGWPPCRARAAECEMVESAADRRAAGKLVLTDRRQVEPVEAQATANANPVSGAV